MMLTVIVLPFALPEKVGISFFPEIFYPISLMVVLWTITATTNGLELHEMTFVLSRPVSRTTYIVGKILASLVTSSLMYFVALILMLINILYFKIKVNYDVITGNNLK
jgi:ABC-type transport system involved in multi-copper enzyme maturation permease subunit